MRRGTAVALTDRCSFALIPGIRIYQLISCLTRAFGVRADAMGAPPFHAPSIPILLTLFEDHPDLKGALARTKVLENLTEGDDLDAFLKQVDTISSLVKGVAEGAPEAMAGWKSLLCICKDMYHSHEYANTPH